MKTVLLKPQRSVPNSVLAYQYEPADMIGFVPDEDPIWWSYWEEDAFCKDGTDCWAKKDAGDCQLSEDSSGTWC